MLSQMKGACILKVNFYEFAHDELFKFAVIVAVHNGKWVFCKHRNRSTYECPGGHREPSEAILETAKRELWEETGAKNTVWSRFVPTLLKMKWEKPMECYILQIY